MAYLTFHIFTKLKQLLIFQKVLNPGWPASMCIVSLFVFTVLGCFLRKKFILSYQNLRSWKQMVKLIFNLKRYRFRGSVVMIKESICRTVSCKSCYSTSPSLPAQMDSKQSFKAENFVVRNG